MTYTPSPAQQQVIAHRGGHLQVIACAGSGKTESVSRRIAGLISEGADPASIVSSSSEYDLSGKTIILFCTHAGSGLVGTVAELERVHSRSTILDGLAVWGRDAKTSHDEVAEWLGRIRIKEGDVHE